MWCFDGIIAMIDSYNDRTSHPFLSIFIITMGDFRHGNVEKEFPERGEHGLGTFFFPAGQAFFKAGKYAPFGHLPAFHSCSNWKPCVFPVCQFIWNFLALSLQNLLNALHAPFVPMLFTAHLLPLLLGFLLETSNNPL